MISKTEQVRNALAAGDHDTALRIGRTFVMGLTRADHKRVVRAAECRWNPDFYKQLGYDTVVEIEAGVKILTDLVSA